MYKILVVEDEVEISRSISNFLKREGYEVTQSTDGKEALERFHNEKFDLLLLDIMLPSMSGTEILAEVRKVSDVPIIIISAIFDELVQQDAFNLSVDDYVIKPFSIKILVYKVAALLRRVYGNEVEYARWRHVKLTVNNYEVSCDGVPVSLTAKEFELLQVLLLNPGKVFTRTQLLTLVWGYDYFGDDRIIDVHIKNIRKKIDPDLIKTIKGVGYKVERE